MKILGIETSCDETAAAVVCEDRRILSNVVLSQLDDHRAYGGVVPEIAARAHLQHLDPVVREALAKAEVTLDQIDGIAATCGPGLIGGVIVGAMLGKGLAAATGKPFIAVNHLEGHALTARLSDDVPFPYLLLLVSGGHCQILMVTGVGAYHKLGSTIDDAVGEAFDKSARMMGLGYPGGPQVEKLARDGDPDAYALPRPLKGRPGCDFSFSGLKTAVRQVIERLPDGQDVPRQLAADLCASFQKAVGEVMADRLKNAMKQVRQDWPETRHLVVAGGVAANQPLRQVLTGFAAQHDLTFIAPPLSLCTDNAAMIAWAGLERHRLGHTNPLDTAPRPRWPLEVLSEHA
ncbi:MAG: tRNA (adenosine(37)-N6)-threonylcarbamoyltransferase complex transferase subunit TsaD [Alphaproteobacteria bacterium]